MMLTPKHWFLRKVIDFIFDYPVKIDDTDPFNRISYKFHDVASMLKFSYN